MSLPVTPFSSCPQTFPASESFPMSWLFASDGQSFGASTSSSALPMNISGLIFLRIDWLDVLAIQRTLKEYSPVPQFKSINSLQLSPPFGPALTLIHNYWKNHSFDYMDLCQQCEVYFLIHCLDLSKLFFFSFNGCSHCQQWFFSPRKKNLPAFPLFPCLLAMSDGPNAMILVFWMLKTFKPVFKPVFSLSSFPFIRRLFKIPFPFLRLA